MTGNGARTTSGVATWILLRLTGLVLSVLVLGHFALTHIVNDVAETNADYVADRLGNAVFVTWDAVMLWMAVIHGAAGLWIIVGEHVPAKARTWRTLLIGSSIAMAVVGSLTLAVAG